MSAIDELRRMLNERGVAHSDHYLSTTWRDGHGILHLAGEQMADGFLVVDMLTPEQAILSTIWRDEHEILQIVRCRDCREYNPELYKHISCELLGRYVEPDGFCAWGERRND